MVVAIKDRLRAQAMAIMESRAFDPKTQMVYDEDSRESVTVQDVVDGVSRTELRSETIAVNGTPVDMTVMHDDGNIVHVRTKGASMGQMDGSEALVYATEHGYSQSDRHGDRKANLPFDIRRQASPKRHGLGSRGFTAFSCLALLVTQSG